MVFCWTIFSPLADNFECKVNNNNDSQQTCSMIEDEIDKYQVSEHRITPTTNSCVNMHKDCDFWASLGECNNKIKKLTKQESNCQWLELSMDRIISKKINEI